MPARHSGLGKRAMRAATSEELIRSGALGVAIERRARTRCWFDHPDEVVDDPTLAPAAKRAVLSSWASDASAVVDEPGMRWLLGTPEPVRLDDIRKALARLDGLDGRSSPLGEVPAKRG